ncbi:unnamed protein product [Mesocestoides corti]|uniref:Uncharacterized protein n=2 Tax=Mesocestoides corti TaxID=53468 RepID=A0A0R3UNU1_MESCO|nr:unnamed protein product [Mesocestoides corti]
MSSFTPSGVAVSTVNPSTEVLIGQNVKSKIQDLFQRLRNYPFLSKDQLRESSKLMYDVQVVEGIVKILNDFSPPDEIHMFCRLFYDSYLSGDKKVKLLVTLLLPSMLNTYLVKASSLETEPKHQLQQQQQQANQSRRSSQPFPPTEQQKSASALESLSFLLSQLCELAPAFIRYPEHVEIKRTTSKLPDLRVPSIFHAPPQPPPTQYVSSKSQVPKASSATSLNPSTLTYNHSGPSLSTHVPSGSTDPDPACVVRIYTDTLMRQFVGGTVEQQGIVLTSIDTFCALVQRVTALNNRRVYVKVGSLLVDLATAIDRILFILSFDHDLLWSGNAELRLSTEELRKKVFDLLPLLDRFASYHCCASVILITSAIQNAWATRLQRPQMNPIGIHRRFRLVSDDPADLSEVVGESTTSSDTEAHAFHHRPSVFTNANFRAEPVSEDIPISGAVQEPVQKVAKKRLHLSEVLSRSSDNLYGSESSMALGAGTETLGRRTLHHHRFMHRLRHEKH